MDSNREKHSVEEISSCSVSPEEDIELFCIPCNRDGSLLSAYGYCQACEEHLCEACYQHHRRTAATMDHILVDKEHMPKGHACVIPSPTDEAEICPDHPNQRIEYYCIQHCVLGCNSCITFGHRDCKVDYIPDVAKNVHHSEELRNIFAEIRALESKCQLSIITARENIKRAKTKEHDVIQEIQAFRHELNKYLDHLEEKTLSEMHEVSHAYMEDLESSKGACLHIAGKMGDLETLLKHLSQTEHLNGLFVEMKKTEQKVEQLKEEAEKAFEKTRRVEYKFDRNDSITKALRLEKNLGKVLESHDKFSTDHISNFHHSDHENYKLQHNLQTEVAEEETRPVLKYVRDVNVKSERDEQEAHITGIAVMSPDKLAVVDNRNGKVKIADLQENAVVSEVKLKSSPFDITLLPNHELAVTLPEEMAVQILHGNKLSMVRRLNFDKHCRGISYARDKLYVTFVAFPGEIRILNLQGEELKLFNDVFFGRRMFDLPCYITVDEKMRNMYVSDYSKGQVTQLSCDGKVLRTFKCRKRGYPDGLATIKDNYVCVCCSSLHYIEIFPKDGPPYKALDALKQDLQYPAALTTDTKKKMFGSFVPKGKKWLERVCMFEIEFPEDDSENDETL